MSYATLHARYNPSTHLFQVLQDLDYGVAGEPNAGLTYAGGKKFFGGTQTGGSGEFATGAIIKFSEP